MPGHVQLRLRGELIEQSVKAELDAKRLRLETRIEKLKGFLAAVETAETEEVDLEAAARAAEEAEAQKKRSGSCGEYTKLAVAILRK